MTNPAVGQFSDVEKTRIRYFLGYPDWADAASAVVFGFPSRNQPSYILDDALNLLTPHGASTVRRALCQCEAVEAQMGAGVRDRIKASKLGEMTLNNEEFRHLQKQLDFWTKRLADALGSPCNAYSSMADSGMGSGRNAKITR